MFTECLTCSTAQCSYGPNRRGQRADSCCVCAFRLGWGGFHGFACKQCRSSHIHASIMPGDVNGVDLHCAPMSSKSESDGPADFASAVRESRRKRLESTFNSKRGREEIAAKNCPWNHCGTANNSPIDFNSAVLKRRRQRLDQSSGLPRSSLINEMNETVMDHKNLNAKGGVRQDNALQPLVANILLSAPST